MERQPQTNKCSTPEPITSPRVSSINTNSLISKITNQTEFKAGQISSRLSKWTEITSDQSILDSVSGYHIEFHSTPKQHMPPRQTHVALKEASALTAEIHKLLSKGVIAVAQHEDGEYLSPIFTRPKKDGSHRLILNLKSLNLFVEYHHFKMESIQSAAPAYETRLLDHSTRPKGCILLSPCG